MKTFLGNSSTPCKCMFLYIPVVLRAHVNLQGGCQEGMQVVPDVFVLSMMLHGCLKTLSMTSLSPLRQVQIRKYNSHCKSY